MKSHLCGNADNLNHYYYYYYYYYYYPEFYGYTVHTCTVSTKDVGNPFNTNFVEWEQQAIENGDKMLHVINKQQDLRFVQEPSHCICLINWSK